MSNLQQINLRLPAPIVAELRAEYEQAFAVKPQSFNAWLASLVAIGRAAEGTQGRNAK
jgi:hypothetical protein